MSQPKENRINMRAKDFVVESETYQPPPLSVGDEILKGKFKNSPAEIKGFIKDKHNQPVLKTNKGDVQLFKPRISKLMKESLSSLVAQDQSERTEYQQFVKTQADNDWDKGAEMYAALKKRPATDIFGEKARLNNFMQMKFDFTNFNEDDWNNYWLLAQHCDSNRAFQKQALGIIKKFKGEENTHYQYLYDRVSCGIYGTQKYGTQDMCTIDF